MHDHKPSPWTQPSACVTFCKWLVTSCIILLLFCGIVLIYAGVGAALAQCRHKDKNEVQYNHWHCDRYYIPSFVFVSIEAGLVLIIGLLSILGQTKTLRLPLLSFLTIITMSMIMGIQKFGIEEPERGLFLMPQSKRDSNFVSAEDVYRLKKEDNDDDWDIVEKFEVVELNNIYTRHAPRIVVVIGYSLIVAGNLLLILVIGMGKLPPVSFPTLRKHRKTMDKFRSYLAAMIAPSSKPLSDDEDEEQNKLVDKEMTRV